MNKKTAIQLLREKVEQKAGRKMMTPKDFDFLSESIFEEIHTRISPSTLKRIWGYLQNDNTPRSTSLNILANYVGYEDWDSFMASAEKEYGILHEEPEPSDGQPDTPINEQDFKKRKSKLKSFFLSATALLLVAVLFTAMWYFFKSTDTSQQQKLHKGLNSYATMDDCLKLFGITAEQKKHYQAVPNLNNIYVWCPTYHHPVWQNDGDSIQLLPTITERWTPAPEQDIPQVQVNLYRSRAYVKALPTASCASPLCVASLTPPSPSSVSIVSAHAPTKTPSSGSASQTSATSTTWAFSSNLLLPPSLSTSKLRMTPYFAQIINPSYLRSTAWELRSTRDSHMH